MHLTRMLYINSRQGKVDHQCQRGSAQGDRDNTSMLVLLVALLKDSTTGSGHAEHDEKPCELSSCQHHGAAAATFKQQNMVTFQMNLNMLRPDAMSVIVEASVIPTRCTTVSVLASQTGSGCYSKTEKLQSCSSEARMS